MLIKYQAMLIAAIVLIVHFTIYWKTEDAKKSLKWSLITLGRSLLSFPWSHSP